jgi:hypothetical protein
MARKPGQSTRPKRNAKQARNASPPRAVETLPATDEVASAPEGSESIAGADNELASGQRPSRKARPYQHRKSVATARASTAATMSISREQEYTFIRQDLRRLLITAGALTAVMIALLFVIDR